MGRSGSIGELEQIILLVLLQLQNASARRLRQELESSANRRISRGALYRTLDRLGEKGFLDWELDEPTPERGGHPKRRFQVTPAGMQALAESRSTLLRLWAGLESVLEER